MVGMGIVVYYIVKLCIVLESISEIVRKGIGNQVFFGVFYIVVVFNDNWKGNICDVILVRIGQELVMRCYFDYDGDVVVFDLFQCIEDDVLFELIVNEGVDGQFKFVLIDEVVVEGVDQGCQFFVFGFQFFGMLVNYVVVGFDEGQYDFIQVWG